MFYKEKNFQRMVEQQLQFTKYELPAPQATATENMLYEGWILYPSGSCFHQEHSKPLLYTLHKLCTIGYSFQQPHGSSPLLCSCIRLEHLKP